MTYEPLHHKYRPQRFSQLVGQVAIATTLSNALRQQRIAPAYLFCGPRGTGKTSSARILAKSLNCSNSEVPTDQPCGTCEICRSIIDGSNLDVIEIDAASNTGVDNIRELIERAQFAPVQCRYKVYVIDECHMLSTAASNALLKTLEEPPTQVVFVLATTDPQRMLATIISRCQRFDFRRIPLDAMVDHLQHIADKEQITITSEAVRLVGQLAQGGLRDAESLLDQLSLLEQEVTLERVWDLVGAVSERDLLALVQAIAHNDGAGVLDLARRLMDRGREPLIVLQSLASFYRDLLIAKTASSRNDLVAITPGTWTQLCDFVSAVDLATILQGQQHLRAAEVQVKNTTQPRLWLEVTLLGLLPAAIAPASGAAPTVSQSPTNQTPIAAPVPAAPVTHPVVSRPSAPAAPSPATVTQKPVEQAETKPNTPVVPPATTPSAPLPQPADLTPPSTPDTNQPPTAAPRPSPPDPVADSTPEPQAEPPQPDQTQSASAADLPKSAEPAQSSPAEPPVSIQPDPLPVQPDPAPAQPVPTRHRPATPPPNLDEIWQTVLGNLQPRSTQILLSQQSHLLGLEGGIARVGVSAQWHQTVKDRADRIEEAFRTALQQPTTVRLEVASPPEQTVNRVPPPQAPPRPAPQRPDQGRSQPSPPPESPKQDPAPSPPSAPPPSNQPNGAEQQPPNPEPRMDWQNEDEVTRAAKNFAQMFNGQIVTDADQPESDNPDTDQPKPETDT